MVYFVKNAGLFVSLLKTRRGEKMTKRLGWTSDEANSSNILSILDPGSSKLHHMYLQIYVSYADSTREKNQLQRDEMAVCWQCTST